MEDVIIIRYNELYLKGENRSFFERLLIRDIRQKLGGIDCSLSVHRGRYIVEGFSPSDSGKIFARLGLCFGVHSFSAAYKCASDIEVIKQASIKVMRDKKGSFKAEVNRADKTFPHTSVETACIVGGYIAESLSLKVDVHDPDNVLSIDIREAGFAFVFCGRTNGPGGMPLYSSGKGLTLLSGGLDSPVAAFMMAKRGMNIEALHFHSYPYTNENAQQKVRDLAARLAAYTGRVPLVSVKLTKIQEAIHKYCREDYMITLLRLIMMKTASLAAKETGCGCLINGESLGQVASQTLESLMITDSVADIPVFRPLIGMDKQEIVDRAKAIGTYAISILPFEDCCTVFLPKHPATKPSKSIALAELAKIPDLDSLIAEALAEKEREIITP